ncbi:MAG TPA: fibronectin type III domain-containing protein [Chloroflexota bacterium]|nr:fibronectin type III domain-containing protein [Chloroflexota bacterium]
MKAALALKRWQIVPVLVILLMFGATTLPAQAQYGYPYGYGYGNYGAPYSGYYGNSYSGYYGNYYSGYYPYSGYYGNYYSSYYPYSYGYNSYYPYSYGYNSYYPYSYGYNSYYPYSGYYGNYYSGYYGYPTYGYGYYNGYYPGYAYAYGGLTAPTGLTVTSNTGNTVTLSWTASVGAITYQVLESTAGGPYVAVTSTPSSATTASVANLVTGVVYSFEVVAVDAYGHQSTPSTPVTVTAGSGGTGLTAPTGLALAGKPSSTSATITWTAVTAASSYRVYQSTAGSAFVLVSTTLTNSATVAGLTPGVSYSFEVIAMDAGGNASPPSQPLTFTQ